MENRKSNHIAYTAGTWPLAKDRPTLIFIHGAGLSAGMFDAQVTGLGRVANTVALDLPGHGKSGGEASDQVGVYADDVFSFIRGINAPRPILCGLSMGGAIAIDLMIRYPDDFEAGVLMHTGARLKVHPMVFDMLRKGLEGYLNLMAEFAVAPGSDKLKIKERIRRIAAPTAEVMAKDFRACDGFERMADLKRIRRPVLVITGREDHITPAKYGEYLAVHIEGAKLEQVTGAGHLSAIEKPEKVNGIIEQFIRELPHVGEHHETP